MTDREMQIEALRTYEISTEKVLRRLVKKSPFSQRQMNPLKSCSMRQQQRKMLSDYARLSVFSLAPR